MAEQDKTPEKAPEIKIRERVKSYSQHLTEMGQKADQRMALTTDQAVALVQQEDLTLVHAEKVTKMADLWVETQKNRPSADASTDELIAFGALAGKVSSEFWDGFEGQVVDGVELVRKR
jgi:hypothetical protein